MKPKKMLNSIGMSCNRIQACPNDCILYWKGYPSLNCCPSCEASRYQKENAPSKVVWYFPNNTKTHATLRRCRRCIELNLACR